MERISLSKKTFLLSGAGHQKFSLFILSVVSLLLSGCSFQASTGDTGSKLEPTLSVALSSSAPAKSNRSSLPLTLAFSQNVSGISVTDLIVSNGTVRDFSGSGKVYTFYVDVSSDGLVSVEFASRVVEVGDSGQNRQLQAPSAVANFEINRESLTVSLSTGVVSPSARADFEIEVVFNKKVVGLKAADFSVSVGDGGLGSIIGVSGAGPIYTLTYVATSSGSFLISIPAERATDEYGNKSSASNILSFDYNSNIPLPTLASTVGVSTNLSSISFSLDFNVDVTGVEASHFSVTNGTISGVNGSNKHYDFTISPIVDGPVSVQYLANKVNNASGIFNSVSNLISFTSDKTSPTLSLANGSSVLGNSTTGFSWIVTYTGADTINLNSSMITLNGETVGCGAPTVAEAGVDTRIITVKGCSGNGSLSISIAQDSASDGAGNKAAAVIPSSNVTVDNSPPTISIGAGAPAIGDSSTTFSWVVTYSGASTIILSPALINLSGITEGCGAPSIQDTGASTRTVSVSGCSGVGSLSVGISSNSASDDAGNLAGPVGSAGSVTLKIPGGIGYSNCPVGYSFVAANDRVGTNSFCIAKFEMKDAGDGTVVSRAAGVPKAATQAEALSQCLSIGNRLIAREEWNAVATEISGNSKNYINGTDLIMGSVDWTGSVFPVSDESNGYTDSNQSGIQRRNFYLENEQVIWDFGGNVWEWVSTPLSWVDLSLKWSVPAGNSTPFSSNENVGSAMEPGVEDADRELFIPLDGLLSANYGSLYHGSAGTSVELRGGGIGFGTNNSGIFSSAVGIPSDISVLPSYGQGGNVGFRCVADPIP